MVIFTITLSSTGLCPNPIQQKMALEILLKRHVLTLVVTLLSLQGEYFLFCSCSFCATRTLACYKHPNVIQEFADQELDFSPFASTVAWV